MSSRLTHVIELTPVGRGAVAVVLVAGPEAVRAVDACFAPASGKPVSAAPVGRVLFGRWGGAVGEEVVICRREAERVEVHCHGGVAAVAAVVEALAAEGCRQIPWQEWLRASEADPIRAAARIALADAPTARTAGILLDQYHGALSSAVHDVVSAIRALEWTTASRALQAMLAEGDVGLHLTRPWRVVLAGAANVGKSSLINRLAGYERAIVSQTPGTTRDVVMTTTAIDGWPVELADTAGRRTAADELEAAGMALADTAIERADLVIEVEDASEPASATTAETDVRRNARPAAIRVRNKIDLVGARRTCAEPGCVETSALTGEGVSELLAMIGQTLVPRSPAVGAAVPFMVEQLAALGEARAAMERRDGAAALAALQSLLAE